MKYYAWIFVGIMVILTAACSQTSDEPVMQKEEAGVESQVDSNKEEATAQEEDEEAAQEDKDADHEGLKGIFSPKQEEGITSEESMDEEIAEESSDDQEDEIAENQEDNSYIHPDLADNAKYVEMMNSIHNEPNQLAVSKEDQYAAVTKLFLLNPEVLDHGSRGLGLSDAELSDGTKLVYLAAAGEGTGAFYFYHPGLDKLVYEMYAEEEFGEYPELVM